MALYLPEARTDRLREWLAERRVALGLNVWQELEFKNAARQKVMRGEASEGDVARTLRIFEDDCIRGRIIRRSVPWQATFAEAERLSRRLALSNQCRSFDLMHVAIAISSGVSDFATLDTRQAKLAEAAGLSLAGLPA